MNKLCLAFCIASLVSLHAADEPPAKPNFWQRTWNATRNVGKKAVEIVKPRSRRNDADESPGALAWQNLAVTMKLEPPQVRLPDTRVIDVTVSVVNRGKEAVRLEFPSSLRMEVLMKARGGKIVSRWSDDQRIEKEPAVVTVNPKERLEYNARVSTRDMVAGQPFEIEAYFPSFERLRTSRTVVPVR